MFEKYPKTSKNILTVSCQPFEFMCNNGLECIDSRFRCDSTAQCSDGSDEYGCTTKLMVKIYPTEQTIEAGREVVFQCRDEGPLRARVSWSRSGGLAMPDRSYDYQGRLTIPNVVVTHTGTYICQATDYPGVEGSTASAYLRVIQSKKNRCAPNAWSNAQNPLKINFRIAFDDPHFCEMRGLDDARMQKCKNSYCQG